MARRRRAGTGLTVLADETLPVGEIRLTETPLAVTSVSPADGAVDVPVTQAIQLQFNAPMASLGVTLRTSDQGLPFAGSLSADGRTYTVTGTWPDSREILVEVTTYYLLTYDVYGRRLAKVFRSRFRTLDLSPPRVVAVTPANEAIQVEPSATVAVTFDEAIVVGGDLQSLVRVGSAQGSVPGQVTSSAPDSLLFTPDAPFEPNLTYTVTVNGATDLLGHVQTAAFTSSFTTPDSDAPVLRLASSAGRRLDEGAAPDDPCRGADALSGPDASRAQMRLDGQAVCRLAGVDSSSHVPPVDLADGPHTVEAAAHDRAGNRGDLRRPSGSTASLPRRPSSPRRAATRS